MQSLFKSLSVVSVCLVCGFCNTVSAHIDITPEQAKLLAETYDALIVVDVREEATEYCNVKGHISGALNLPWNSGALESRIYQLPKDKAILVVCQSGGRSHQAAAFLDGQGFLLVFDMAGGMNAWLGKTVRCVDIDRDGIYDDVDTCPCDADPNQIDSDGDGIGDLCDTDTPGLNAKHLNISVAQAQELVNSGLPIMILDVRESYEYCRESGYIPGALNYPWNSGVLASRVYEIPRDRILLVLCQSGGRSNQAAQFLDSMGYHHVFDMLGGMGSWPGETESCD